MDYSQPQTANPWGLYPTQGQAPLPLRSLEIRIEIIHTVARVFYTQQYFNNTNLLLETEFFFPISPDACFDSFEATFNNTTIKGVVKEKEKAKEEYKEAVEQGRTAAYSEINQETGDIMKVQIGNIPPNTNVSIKYSYILKLDTMLNKFWCFRLFSTLTPRYNSGKNNLKDVLSRDVDILSKYPTISGNNSEAYPWTIQAEIQSPSPITFLKSPSHQIIVEYGNENHTCKIALDPSSQHLPNKDFVLLYTNGREGEKLDYLLTPFEEGYCAMVSMLADFDKDTGETAFAKFEQAKEIENQYSMNMIRGEYIMLVDRSGSMSGERINMAKESLILFLKSLPKESYFNIVSFGSSFEFLHNSSVAYSQQSLNTSVAQIETFEADMGGTEIFQPLSSVFNSPLKKGYPRFIFLLTDGDVSNTRQVLDLIMTNNDKARVFTIGIGNGCSPELITKAASYGRGRHEFVTENSQINQKVIGLLNASLSPCYSDLSLHSDNFDAVVKSVSPNPASIPFLINGQTVTFFLFLRSAAFQDSQMRLQLRLYDSRSKKNCHLDVELDLSNAMENDLLPKLAIHDMIKRLDTQKDQVGQNKIETDVVWMEKADLRQAMVEYSLKYGILCKETAFFCEVVDSEKQNVNLLPAKVIIPTIQSSDYNQLQRCSQGLRGSNITYSKRLAKACSFDYAQYPRYQLLQEKRDEYSVEMRSQKREELLCKKRNRNLDVDYKCYFKLQPEPIPDNLIKINPSYLDIIKQQTFEGSWDTSDQGLLKTVLVDNTQFSPPQQIKDMNSALADTIWITVLVLRWLELACKEDRKAWMLVYQKGCEWLKDHGIDYEEVKGIAESSIRV